MTVRFFEVMVSVIVETENTDDDYAYGECFEYVQGILASAGKRKELDLVNQWDVIWPVLLEEYEYDGR